MRATMNYRYPNFDFRFSIFQVARMAASYGCNLFGLGRLFPVKSIV